MSRPGHSYKWSMGVDLKFESINLATKSKETIYHPKYFSMKRSTLMS